METIPKTFHCIPLHINPSTDDVDQSIPHWLCNLKFLSSTASPTSVFAIGLDDLTTPRHVYCTSLSVTVKETIVLHPDDQTSDSLALHYQRPYAMMRRQQNASIGKFLHGLSLSVSTDKRLQAVMLSDGGESEDEFPSDDSTLTLMMHIEFNPLLGVLALETGIIFDSEEIEHIDLSLKFSRVSRPAHVASLAVMMASHPRLGGESRIGRMLGADLLHLVCDMYELRLYECRNCVWSE